MRGFFIGEGVALKVEKVKISEIRTAEYNPRQTLKPGDVAWELQFTLSMRRATLYVNQVQRDRKTSIHALHAESDHNL